MTDIEQSELGEFPATAKGMCELSKAAFERLGAGNKHVIPTLEAWLLPYGEEHTYRERPWWLKRMEPQMCFANAFALVQTYAEEHELIYCEGYLLDAALPINIHHAWTIDHEGVVIDPTLDEELDRSQITYFGVPMPDFEEIVDTMMDQGALLTSNAGRALIEKRYGRRNP